MSLAGSSPPPANQHNGKPGADYACYTDVAQEGSLFYRKLEDKLNVSLPMRWFGTAIPRPWSALLTMERPFIDPVVFHKLQLILYFKGIRSERQLMDTVNLNLAHRWYIGYDLDEAVPNHSSLTKSRERCGLVVLQRCFEKIVELCQAVGPVWGKELYDDYSSSRLGQHVCMLLMVYDICAILVECLKVTGSSARFGR